LLGAGRVDEAYERYALTASETATGLARFRAIAKKYPHREPSGILSDLAESSGDTGRYFAAAKDAGFFDLALKFAEKGRTDPRTLSRAARDAAAPANGAKAQPTKVPADALLRRIGGTTLLP